MNKRILTGFAILWTVGIFSACTTSGGKTNETTDATDTTENTKTNDSTSDQITSQLQSDGTIVDSDGFVRMPGEPSRGDDGHYYLTGDICEQFTKAYIEKKTGKTLRKAAPPEVATVPACYYYVSSVAQDGKDDYFLLLLEFMSVENQKKGQVALDRTIETDPRIPMDHFIARQENGTINAIYFVFGANKFLRLDRSSTSALTDVDALQLAIQLGEKMKDFK